MDILKLAGGINRVLKGLPTKEQKLKVLAFARDCIENTPDAAPPAIPQGIATAPAAPN